MQSPFVTSARSVKRAIGCAAALLLLIPLTASADHLPPDSVNLEEITVTATRLERSTKDVPEAIVVIDKSRIENSRMFNLTDALSGTPGVNISSKSGGYDARLILRGGGLKANYGIREIFLMRDGVPITDPDSFTRLDFIDTQDVEQIEVTKGPGNIYATGSSAGVIHLISKSVFDQTQDSVTLAGGDQSQGNVQLRLSEVFGQHALAVTASYRADDNDWRRNNDFESKQISVKYGYRWENGNELATEFSFAEVDLDLPGNLNETQFADYRDNGRQRDNSSFFKTGGRYSRTWHWNLRYEAELMEHWSFKPRLYFTHWEQDHPVTPFIVTNGGVDVFGGDLEFVREQSFGSFITGLTLRKDIDDDAERFEYRDRVTDFDALLESGEGTQSQQRGDLAETQDTENTVLGFFAQQSIAVADRWIIDLGIRFDTINIDQETHTLSEFNFPYGTEFGPPFIPKSAYDKVDIRQSIDKDFDLLSARLGVSYAYSENLSFYFNLARGEQVPFSNELETNTGLDAALTKSIEVGIKGRHQDWSFDLAIYQMEVEDEVVAGLDENDETVFQNAGRIDKKGLELTSNVRLFDLAGGEFWGGVNYAYSDYSFEEFTEHYSFRGMPAVNINDGNSLPFIPEHYYSLNLLYQHPIGLSVRLQSDTWDEYQIDNANTDEYGGYEWLTSLNLRYTFLRQHSLSLNVQNISDKRYATIVKKNAGQSVSYTVGEPRTWLLSYRYQF